MWGKAEISIINGLPLNEWLWLAALLIISLVALYTIGQTVKIMWRD